jgi:hypothetical protein
MNKNYHYTRYAFISNPKSRYYSSILKITGLRNNQKGPTLEYVYKSPFNINEYKYIVLEIPGDNSRNPQICLSVSNVIILTAEQILDRLSFQNWKKYEIPSIVDWKDIIDQHHCNSYLINHKSLLPM